MITALLGFGAVAVITATPAAAVATNPFGYIDALRRSPTGVHVQGWAIDPNTVQPIYIRLYTDGVLKRQVLANQSRADIAAAYPGYGPLHGFNLTMFPTDGTHTICINLVNVGPGSSVQLGCRTVTVSHNPVGAILGLIQGTGGFSVGGYALDPDSAAPINIDYYADGQHLARGFANQANTAAGQAWPEYGNLHGYTRPFSIAQGTHNICVVGSNVGSGANATIACRSITLNYNPRGVLDPIGVAGRMLHVSGWAYDPDQPKTAINVNVSIDGKLLRQIPASLARQDVASRYPAAGLYHGYALSYTVPVNTLAQGNHQICVVAINIGPGTGNSQLGCQTITLNYSPIGAFDSLSRVNDTTLHVAGWAADPDTANPITVQVAVGGTVVTTATASTSRPDVTKVHPWVGSNHGYALNFTTSSGEHNVCITAINVLQGSNTSLGCRYIQAAHPTAPSAPSITGVQTGFGQISVTWNPPATDGGSLINRYVLTTSPASATVTVGPNVRTAVVGGLKGSTYYRVFVQAGNPVGLSAAAATASVLTAASPPPQTTPAPVSTSRYIRDLNGTSSDVGTMKSRGATDAYYNPSGHQYLILLDIGGQGTSSGVHGVVLSATTRWITDAHLVTAIEAYVDGYATNQKSSAPVAIAIGTNNDMDVNAANGAVWANEVVNPVVRYAQKYSNIRIFGANDIEPGFSATVSQSRSWLSGFLSASSTQFVFNGSADGCSWTQANGSCNNGWQASDLYWLSAGAAPTRMQSLPQIYNTTMPQQWRFISLTGVLANSPKVNFGGPLTEFTACQQAGSCSSMTGHDAWTALWTQIRADARTTQGSLPWSTDLRIN